MNMARNLYLTLFSSQTSIELFPIPREKLQACFYMSFNVVILGCRIVKEMYYDKYKLVLV